MDSTSRTIRFSRWLGFPVPVRPAAAVTARSDAHRKTAPDRKPRVTTSQGGRPPIFSAQTMAGCSNDQKLAAIITPEAKPSMRFIILALGDRKKATVAAPSAVTAQVPRVAIRAQST